MINIEYLDRTVVEIDAVDHAVRASSRAKATRKRTHQWLANSERILGQWPAEDFQYGSSYRLR